MAYTENTGIAGPAELIDAICTFLGANGWTVERNNLVGSNRTATVRVAGVTDYIHLYNVNTSEVRMLVSVGYDGSNPPPSSTNGQPFYQVTNGLTGPYPRVYFFHDNEAAHIVVSTILSQEYRHLCFGMADKIGVYDGGTYADGTWRNPDNYLGDLNGSGNHVPFGGASNTSPASQALPSIGAIRCDIAADSRANFFHYFGDSGVHPTYGRAWTGWGSWSQDRYLGRIVGGADRNTFSGRSIGHPIQIDVVRTGSPSYLSPIAIIRNTRACNLTKLDVGQEITVGSDIWKVFPTIKKSMLANGGFNAPDYGSHTTGYAIKKVA